MGRISSAWKRKEARIFLIFVAFVVLLSGSAFKVTDILHSDLENVIADEITKERLLNRQIQVLAERRVLIRDIVLEADPFARDEKIQEHSINASRFLQTRDELLAMNLSDKEKDIFQEQVELNRQGYQIQLDLIDRLLADHVNNPAEEVLQDIQPVLKGINDRLLEQRDLLITDSDVLRREARLRYERGWVWVLTFYIGTLIFTGFLTFWIYRRLKIHQTDLEYQATHDALTGLTNRAAFERQLKAALGDTHTNQITHALLYLDLDQFKIVNDTGGHIAGDELLKCITMEIRRCIRGSDLLARLGGDEFGILLWDCNETKASEIANSIVETVSSYRFVWTEREYVIGVSIGLITLNDYFRDITDAMSAVDVACYIAKDQGRNRVHIYTEDDTESSKHHGELHRVSQVRRALSENRFRLFIQPIVPIKDGNENRKVEVLLRMQHGDELIGPDQFIPAAERFNMMSQVDRWVFQHVLTMLSSKDSVCLQETDTICINLSAASLVDTAFLDYVEQGLDNTDLGGKQLCFEITESAAIAKLSRAVNFINRLRKRGCKFALDDFGKGLSSFTYLKQLPVDYLKIDGGFVREMHLDSADYKFVEAISNVGHALGKQVVAEWVENANVASLLKELGVDYAQGNYFAAVQACTDYEAELVVHTPPRSNQ